MRKNREKIMKNFKAKAGVYTTFILLLIACFSALFFVTPNVEIVKGADPGDFASYKTITFNTSQIPGDLENFPVLLNLSGDMDLYDDLTDTSAPDSVDLAFFNDTDVQLNHEVEYIENMGGGQLNLYVWVNVTHLDGDDATSIKMYYDDGVGGTDYQNITDTWDSDYVMVHHFNSTNIGSTLDSTSNNNDGNVIEGDPSFTQTGIAGYSVYYDGNDGLEISDSASLDITSDLTLEAFANPDSSGRFYAITKWSTSGGDDKCYALALDTDFALRGRLAWSDSSATDVDGSTALGATAWNHMAVVYDDSGNTFKAYMNGTEDASEAWDHPSVNTNNFPLTISGYYTGGAPGQPIIGYLDECRISKTARSANWLKTTFNSIVNATDGGFYTLGGEESPETTASLNFEGSSNNYFTTSGTVPGSYYANNTGDYYETANLTITIDGTNVEYIRVNVSDIHANITANYINISFDDDNSSWSGNWHSCTAGGESIIVNGTNWDANNWMSGNNPFTADGDTDGYNEIQSSTSIYWRVRVSYPNGIGAENYSKLDMTYDGGHYT